MATDKKKKEVKVRDLKPSKDAKGGSRHVENAGIGRTTSGGQHGTNRGPTTNTLR